MKRQSMKNKGKILDADTLDPKAPKESADKVDGIKTDTGFVIDICVIFLPVCIIDVMQIFFK